MPSRPTGSSPTPSAASRPSAAASSALDGWPGGAERDATPGPARRRCVSTAIGPSPAAGRDRRGRRRRATSRGRRAPADGRRSARRPRRPASPFDRCRSSAASSAQTANTAVRRRSAPGRCRRHGRCRAGGGTRGRRAGAADRCPAGASRSPGVVAHDVERRDRGHGTCWHRASAERSASDRARLRRRGLPARLDPDGRDRRPPPARRPAPGGRPQPGVVERQGGARRRAAIPVLVVDIAKGSAGAAVGRARRPARRVVAGVRRRGGGDGRPRLAAVRPLPRRARRRHVRRSGRRRGSRRRRRRRSPPGPSSGAATTRRRAASRSATRCFPVAQVVIEGPRRTAATGALMSLVGLRFWMARQADPAAPRPGRGDGRADERGDGERRRRAVTASRRRRVGVHPRRPGERAGADRQQRDVERVGTAGDERARAAAPGPGRPSPSPTSWRARESTPGRASERPQPCHASAAVSYIRTVSRSTASR